MSEEKKTKQNFFTEYFEWIALIIGSYLAIDTFLNDFNITRFVTTTIVIIAILSLGLFFKKENSLYKYTKKTRFIGVLTMLIFSTSILLVINLLDKKAAKSCTEKNKFSIKIAKFNTNSADILSERIILNINEKKVGKTVLSPIQLEYIPIITESYSLLVDSIFYCDSSGILVHGYYDPILNDINCKIKLHKLSTKKISLSIIDTVIILKNPSEVEISIDSSAMIISNYILGLSVYHEGENDAGIKILKSLKNFKLYKQNLPLRSNISFIIGTNYLAKGEIVEAIAYYENAISLDSSLKKDVYFNLKSSSLIILENLLDKKTKDTYLRYLTKQKNKLTNYYLDPSYFKERESNLSCLISLILNDTSDLREILNYIKFELVYSDKLYDKIDKSNLFEYISNNTIDKEAYKSFLRKTTNIKSCDLISSYADSLYNILVSQEYYERLQKNMILDPDGNIYKVKLLKDGNYWMTENLRYYVNNSWCYNNNKSFCKSNGRLYTASGAAKACEKFGFGWHLPSLKELKFLIRTYEDSLITSETSYLSKSTYKYIITDKNIPLGIDFSGARFPKYKHIPVKFNDMDTVSYYWLNDGNNNISGENGFSFTFDKNDKRFEYQTEQLKEFAHSVICTCKK